MGNSHQTIWSAAIAGVASLGGIEPAIAQVPLAHPLTTPAPVTYQIATQWDLTPQAPAFTPATALPPLSSFHLADAAPLTVEDLDLPPEMLEQSPLLRRWLEEIPDVRSDIRHDPSFATRLYLGYDQSPGGAADAGLSLSLRDWFIGRSGLTVSGDYSLSWTGDREAWGADLRYYLRPLGSYLNIAPTFGYRAITSDRGLISGETVGVHIILALSRTGAADLTFTQHWLNPGAASEAGLMTITAGYALTPDLRLATTLSRQNTRHGRDSRVGLGLEWLL